MMSLLLRLIDDEQTIFFRAGGSGAICILLRTTRAPLTLDMVCSAWFSAMGTMAAFCTQRTLALFQVCLESATCPSPSRPFLTSAMQPISLGRRRRPIADFFRTRFSLLHR